MARRVGRRRAAVVNGNYTNTEKKILQLGRTCTYHLTHSLGGATGDRALLDDDGTRFGVPGNFPGSGIKCSHVGGPSRPDAKVLGGGVDSKEDHVSPGNAGLRVAGEEQVGQTVGRHDRGIVATGFRPRLAAPRRNAGAIARNPDNIIQASLVDREMKGVPAADAALVLVEDIHPDGGVVQGDDGCGRTA